ncbi:hypothetical protein BDF22DRAFT_685273 [Syncephalis plumigaleata]|nr:hypothetical protein BDF22DRAFT_685273 [Syncephalis plumigaleata]
MADNHTDQNNDTVYANIAKVKTRMIKTNHLIELYNKTTQNLKQAELELQTYKVEKEEQIKQWMDKAMKFEKEAQHRGNRWQQATTEKRELDQKLTQERKRAEAAEAQSLDESLKIDPMNKEIQQLQRTLEEREQRCRELESQIRGWSRRVEEAEEKLVRQQRQTTRSHPKTTTTTTTDTEENNELESLQSMKLAWEMEKKRNDEQRNNNESRALKAAQQRATRLEQEKKAYNYVALQNEIEQLTIEKRALQELVTDQQVDIVYLKSQLSFTQLSDMRNNRKRKFSELHAMDSRDTRISSNEVMNESVSDEHEEIEEINESLPSSVPIHAKPVERSRSKSVSRRSNTSSNTANRASKRSRVNTTSSAEVEDSPALLDEVPATVAVATLSPSPIPPSGNTTDDIKNIKCLLDDMENSLENLTKKLEQFASMMTYRPDSVLTALTQYWRLMKTHFFQSADLVSLASKGFNGNLRRFIASNLPQPACRIPQYIPLREAHVILLVWLLHHQWPETNLIPNLLAALSHELIQALGDESVVAYACRITRFLSVLWRNSGNLMQARVFVYDILSQQCMGDNLVPILENLAKIWPNVFMAGDDEPNRMFMLIQSIVAGLEGSPVQLQRMTAEASYHRMWETFHVLCKWPIHSDAPYLDTVHATLVEEINTLPSDQSEDDTTADIRFDIQMAINLASKYLKDENNKEMTGSTEEPSVANTEISLNASDKEASITSDSSTTHDTATTTTTTVLRRSSRHMHSNNHGHL